MFPSCSFNSSLNHLNIQLNAMDFTEDKLRTIFYNKGSVRRLVMDIGFKDFDRESISEKTDNKKKP